MKLLVGNTGLIGTTLKNSFKFDYEFNSKNLDDIEFIDFRNNTPDLHLCCLPATKWKVDKDPQSDLANMLRIVDRLSTGQYNNVVLYSTIDIYHDMEGHIDENTIPKISKLNYGSIRYMFEVLITSNIKFNKLIIIRLPALFGVHIKKNIIYDLLNNNELNKIKLKSSYQWYNLEKLAMHVSEYLNSTHNGVHRVNLFTEPIETSKLLELFDVNRDKVDCKSPGSRYNCKTKNTDTGYIELADSVCESIRTFISTYKIFQMNPKVAVCIFGEQRDLLNRISDWKKLREKFNLNIDFYIALYYNDTIQDTIRILKTHLNIKDYEILYNDLDRFNAVKFQAKTPIYLYGNDPKAIISRLLSQLYIRQKSVSMIEGEYDLVMLCRSDVSKFSFDVKDVLDVLNNEKLLIVSNEDYHIHPGGGGGCLECTYESRCDKKYHSNDICDFWCMGSASSMNAWKTIYDNAIFYYTEIQSTSKPINEIEGLTVLENLNENEISITFPIESLKLIENDIHCLYPEKLIRIAFKDQIILSSRKGSYYWI